MTRYEKKLNFFLSVYEDTHGPLLKRAVFKTSNQEVGKDLVQQAFMKFWIYIKDNKEIKNPKALIYKIANNLIIEWYRKKKQSSLEELMEKGLSPADKTQVENIEKNAEIHNVFHLLNLLPRHEQDLIVLRYVEGLTPGEIGNLMDEEENTISVRLHRSVNHLRSVMHTA